MSNARNNYEFAEGELIDYYLYQIKANQAKLDYLIKKAKELMITKGHIYYQSRKLDRVPREAVEEILGIRFSNENRSE